MTPYPILDVSADRRFLDEPMGTKRKFWWLAVDGTRWLFKYARAGTGEHWSEKIAAEIGSALGIPCAYVELATCDGEPGCVSRSFLPEDAALVHGNELLQEIDATYPTATLRGVSKHTVGAVLQRLESVDPPTGAPTDTAVASFVGYLLLDALIANSDRHHENWAVIQTYQPVPARRLAPSYDHASSLGREISDEQRRARLDGRDRRNTVAAYLQRARSAFYAAPDEPKSLHPVDAFRAAAHLFPDPAALWLARLRALGQDVLEAIVHAVPANVMSEPSQRFAIAVLRSSRAALLGGES